MIGNDHHDNNSDNTDPHPVVAIGCFVMMFVVVVVGARRHFGSRPATSCKRRHPHPDWAPPLPRQNPARSMSW